MEASGGNSRGPAWGWSPDNSNSLAFFRDLPNQRLNINRNQLIHRRIHLAARLKWPYIHPIPHAATFQINALNLRPQPLERDLRPLPFGIRLAAERAGLDDIIEFLLRRVRGVLLNFRWHHLRLRQHIVEPEILLPWPARLLFSVAGRGCFGLGRLLCGLARPGGFLARRQCVEIHDKTDKTTHRSQRQNPFERQRPMLGVRWRTPLGGGSFTGLRRWLSGRSRAFSRRPVFLGVVSGHGLFTSPLAH